MYGCETWSMTEDRLTLNTQERNIRRTVCAPKTSQGLQNKINQKPQELYKTSKLVEDIQRKKLNWLVYAI
jgi:hypothetical protein